MAIHRDVVRGAARARFVCSTPLPRASSRAEDATNSRPAGGAVSSGLIRSRINTGVRVNPGPCWRVISGGQTGVDQAALRAAFAAGIPTGVTAAKGWATEEGPAPWLADFGLVECDEPGDPPRTRANVRDSDGTLWIGSTSSPGGRLTIGTAEALGKPVLIVRAGETTPADVRRWLAQEGVRALNVDGNRESTEPGIGARAEAFLGRVFREDAEGRAP